MLRANLNPNKLCLQVGIGKLCSTIALLCYASFADKTALVLC